MSELDKSSDIMLARELPRQSKAKQTMGGPDYDLDSDEIFALDEDTKTLEFSGQTKQHFTSDFDADSGESSDELSDSTRPAHTFSASSRLPPRSRHSGRGVQGPLPNTSARLPSSSIAASLPVKISNGFWPPREAIDSLPDEDSDVCAEIRPRAKTILPQREDDIFNSIKACSRSIQPADDPERLFGERPRRRYRTGEQDAGSQEELNKLVGTSFSVVGSTSAAPLPMAVARDLNKEDSAVDFNDGSTPRATPKVIVPSSLSSRF